MQCIHFEGQMQASSATIVINGASVLDLTNNTVTIGAVSVNGDLTIQSTSVPPIISGSLTIASKHHYVECAYRIGGTVTGTVHYAPGSVLAYTDSANTYSRGGEWSASSVPYDVFIAST